MHIIKTVMAMLLLIFTALSYAAAETIDKVIVVVNDDVITQKEVQEKMALAKKQLAAMGEAPSDEQLQQQVVERLIDRTLQLQVAKKAKIEVSDVEVDNAIREIAKRNHVSVEQMKTALVHDGITFSDYQRQIREEVLIGKVVRQAVNPNINITDEEVTGFLRGEKTDDNAPREYHILDLVLSVSDKPSAKELQQARTQATKVAQQLRSNGELKKIIQEFNLQQQDLDWRALPQLPAIFIKPVSHMNKGDVSAPIQAPNGFHVIKILEVRSPVPANLTPEQAREVLYQRKLAENLQAWLKKLREQSYLEKKA